ncbi:hypothetical protein QFZ27_001456 [Inquilinus ginsengisoli]|uniref:hypothetical protein n=1 Tax=Inquilinus ginsengisoli TaxID=363840 RepID=UPI003D1CDC1D
MTADAQRRVIECGSVRARFKVPACPVSGRDLVRSLGRKMAEADFEDLPSTAADG